jgi:hypothetical protein
MPAAIDTEVKRRVVNQWLSGDTRDRIAADNRIGAGTVSNIINEWKKGVEDSDYDSVRELAVHSKKEGFGLSHIASSTRLNNYIQKLGANQDQIESLIANLANSPEPGKLIDVANQVAHVSISESIPLADLETHVKQREEEVQRLEEEIKHKRAILESTNVDVQTISEYTHLKEELSKYRLSTEDPTRLLSILRTIKKIGYEPNKIVARFSHIESLRQTEKGFKNNCKILEKRIARCQEVLPLSEQIVRLRIGIGELLAFHTAVSEKAEMYDLSMESAAYRVIEDIQYYNKLAGMKKELSDVTTKVFVMNQFSARQNNAVMTLIKLQSQGVTEDQILSLSRGESRGQYNNARNHSGFPQHQMSV